MSNKLLLLFALAGLPSAASPIYQQAPAGITINVCATTGPCPTGAITIQITPGSTPPVSGAPVITVTSGSGATTPPVTTPPVTTPPVTALPLVLPAVFFPANGSTPTHPYNVPATSFPDDTRCFNKPGGCTPINFATTCNTSVPFGCNYIVLDDSMPWTVVDSGVHPEILTTLHVDNIFGDAPYDVPNVPMRGVPIEGGLRKCVANGGTDDGHDHHGLPYDVRTKLLWEAYQVCTTTGDTTGEYHTATFANPAWDATRFNTRPLGQDSVEAAGREVVPWTLRWQELNSGEVKHAVRFTPKFTRGSSGDSGAFAFPAVHAAPNNGDSPFYEGMRLRFDCNKHLTNDGTNICSDAYLATLTVQQARFVRMLRDYGIVVADNSGGGYYITCDNDPAWDDFQWVFLHVKLGDFVPVNSAPVTDIHGNSLTSPTGG